MSTPDWDRQFAETAAETRERWRAIKRKRIAEGKCWQCAKPIAECRCPNVRHAVMDPAGVRAAASMTGKEQQE